MSHEVLYLGILLHASHQLLQASSSNTGGKKGKNGKFCPRAVVYSDVSHIQMHYERVECLIKSMIVEQRYLLPVDCI
jgi:hypothetical protein